MYYLNCYEQRTHISLLLITDKFFIVQGKFSCCLSLAHSRCTLNSYYILRTNLETKVKAS